MKSGRSSQHRKNMSMNQINKKRPENQALLEMHGLEFFDHGMKTRRAKYIIITRASRHLKINCIAHIQLNNSRCERGTNLAWLTDIRSINSCRNVGLGCHNTHSGLSLRAV
jgi:hypothetical protein